MTSTRGGLLPVRGVLGVQLTEDSAPEDQGGLAEGLWAGLRDAVEHRLGTHHY